VLAWVRGRKALAFVEIKEGGKTYPRIEAIVLEEIARAGAAPLSTVISFSLATLRRLRQMDSQISLGIDFNRPLLAIRRAKSIGATSLLPHWAFASQGFIARAHRAGLRVLVWDADRPGALRRMISRGVDGVVTRYPAKAAEIRTPGGSGTMIDERVPFVKR
jgi:glycerophosphoryl diester phosphodiesterase